MWSVWLVFHDCGFQSVCPLMEKNKRLMKASWWERLRGKLGFVLIGGAMLSKSLIQFYVDGPGCVLSLLFDLRSNYGGGNEDNRGLLQKVLCMCCHTQCLQTFRQPLPTHVPARESWTLTGKSGSVSHGVSASFCWVQMCTRLCLCPPRVCFPSPV